MSQKKKYKTYKEFLDYYLSSSTGDLEVEPEKKDDIQSKVLHTWLIQDNTGRKKKRFAKNKIIEQDFDRYKVKIELTSEDKFIRILEINVKKDFRTYSEKMNIGDHEDILKYFIK